MTLRGATCFSGIGAPELGMPQYEWAWHAEVEPFPAAVLAHRFGAGRPEVMPSPDAEGLNDDQRRDRRAAIKRLDRIEWGTRSINLGDVLASDFLERARALGPLDIMAGGPPCQAFSLAGLRGSMGDPRGNLSLRWVQILHAAKPRNAITENVPGWLSTADNAFGCFLAGLVGADDPLPVPGEQGRWPDEGMVEGPWARAAWRILDAQYFGVAQRRRRVFLVADFGNGADPAEILFERASLYGNPTPRRETGQRASGTFSARTAGGGGLGTDFECDGGLVEQVAAFRFQRTDRFVEDDCVGSLAARDQKDGRDLIAHSLRAEGFDASEDGTGRGTPIIPVHCFDARQQDVIQHGDRSGPLDTDPHTHAILQPLDAEPYFLTERGREDGSNLEFRQDGTANTILTPNGGRRGMGVGAIAIQERAVSENPDNGPDGIGIRTDDLAYTLEARTTPQAVAFPSKDYGGDAGEISPTLRSGHHAASHANSGAPPAIAGGSQVRRLTPVECHRLQGFPDDHCFIPWMGGMAPDGLIYRALGNSWARPVGTWIGDRMHAAQTRAT